MPKPFVNLADVEFNDVEDNGFFTSRRALFSAGIGARKLGYNLTVVPPGKAQCPFHSHRGEEEMFLILEGEGELRYGDQRYAIRKHDVIACPTGGAEVAHQLINTGCVEMRYLALSNLVEIETCEYPDSSKIAGLQIQRLALEPDGEDTWRYALLVVRGGNPKDEFVGHVAVHATLASAEGGSAPARTLVLPEDDPASASALALKFKYYQRVEGRIRVPAGHRVTAMAVRAYEAGHGSPRATRTLTLD